VFRSTHARRSIVAACLALLAIAHAPGTARAHADLATAEPAPNGSVVEAPERLRLTFTEAVDAATAAVTLLDTRQEAVPGVGSVEVSDDGLTITVPLPRLEPGVFTVSYQVVSRVDGHATAGIYAFLVDPTGSGAPPADSAVERSPSVDAYTVTARWVALAALLVAMGSLVLWRTSGRDVLHGHAADSGAPWNLVAGAAVAGAAGLALYLWLAARPIESAGTGIPLDVAGAFGWSPFAIAMRVTVSASIAAGLAAVVAGRTGWPGWFPIVAGLLATALGGMSLAGHAAAAGGLAFAALDWGHLLGAAAWLGGLPAAFVLARRARADGGGILSRILRRHGRVALVAAPVVVLTGIANSPLVLGRARDLVGSDYGNLLLAKAALVGMALGIGAVNHLALRGRGRTALGVLVGAELIVAALAVSAAATMVTIQPAAARQPVVNAPPVAPAHYAATLDHAQVHLAVSLPAPGTQSYRVTIRHPGSTASPPVQKVFLAFTPPSDADLPSERVELEPDELGGPWSASGPHTPFVGEWTVELIVRRQGVLDASFAFELDVIDPGPGELGPPPDTGVGVPGPLAAAWAVVPSGPAGWLPGSFALAVLVLAWWLPRGVLRDVGRGAAATALVIAVLAVGSRELVAVANTPSDADLADQPPVVEPVVERGRELYLANCASCHGVELDGAGPVVTLPRAGPLGELVRSASDGELSYRIAYGVAGTAMPAFAGSLTTAERSDLIGYLRANAETP
jgi:copper transport protein